MSTGARRKLFEQTYQQELPFVVSTLRRLAVPPKDLEDLAQEVFSVLYKRIEQVDPSRSLRPWLFTVCRMVAANLRRRHASQAVDVEDQRVAQEVDPSPTPIQAAELRQKREHLFHALQQLSEERQMVFILYELDGVPMSEIAAMQQVPLHTAYSRLKAARVELQRLLSVRLSEAS